MINIGKVICNLKSFLIRLLNGSRFILIVNKIGLLLLIRGEIKGMRLNRVGKVFRKKCTNKCLRSKREWNILIYNTSCKRKLRKSKIKNLKL